MRCYVGVRGPPALLRLLSCPLEKAGDLRRMPVNIRGNGNRGIFDMRRPHALDRLAEARMDKRLLFFKQKRLCNCTRWGSEKLVRIPRSCRNSYSFVSEVIRFASIFSTLPIGGSKPDGSHYVDFSGARGDKAIVVIGQYGSAVGQRRSRELDQIKNSII
jgi:hypothetical protein